MKLTKSQFNNYLACPKEYWLAPRHPGEVASTWDEAAKFRARQGYEVETKVKELLLLRGEDRNCFRSVRKLTLDQLSFACVVKPY